MQPGVLSNIRKFLPFDTQRAVLPSSGLRAEGVARAGSATKMATEYDPEDFSVRVCCAALPFCCARDMHNISRLGSDSHLLGDFLLRLG